MASKKLGAGERIFRGAVGLIGLPIGAFSAGVIPFVPTIGFQIFRGSLVLIAEAVVGEEEA